VASPELTNPRAARVKAARRLATRTSRYERRQFLVEGAQAVREALVGAAAGEVAVRELFITAEAASGHEDLLALARKAAADVQLVSADVGKALSETVTPQGVVAVCDFLDRPINEAVTATTRLVALLAEVRDPGNAGSVVRAADAAGADAVVFSAGSVDPYNGKVVRASVGGLFHLPVVSGETIDEAVVAAHIVGMQVLAADGSGRLDLDDVERDGTLARPTAWLFGNEAWGLPAAVRESADAVVRIPIHGRAESLNLATAAALCLYASARAQRGPASSHV
jgi:TrmH family RNA methyltransferase